MKRVLITGGNGFVGRQIVKPLLESGFEVHILTRQQTSSLNQESVFVHQHDLLDLSLHKDIISTVKPTHLIQSAWYTDNGLFWNADENIDWMLSTVSLARAFYHAGGRRILGIGTCAEYDWGDGVCVEGKTLERPSTFYGKIKKSTYKTLSHLADYYSAEFAWARIFSPFGPDEDPVRLIPYVITSLLQNTEARCTHGEQIRDFLHVEEIGSALAATLNSDLSGVINIGSGEGMKIKTMILEIGSILNKPHLIKLGAINNPANSPDSIVADTTKLNNIVGWKPKWSFQESLKDTVNWWSKKLSKKVTKGELDYENGN